MCTTKEIVQLVKDFGYDNSHYISPDRNIDIMDDPIDYIVVNYDLNDLNNMDNSENIDQNSECEKENDLMFAFLLFLELMWNSAD